jgi:fucose 4-O-acetylase-like acetyltransferase
MTKREEWIEIVKGFATLLVVQGHLLRSFVIAKI